MKYPIEWLKSAIYNAENQDIKCIDGEMSLEKFLKLFVFSEMAQRIPLD